MTTTSFPAGIGQFDSLCYFGGYYQNIGDNLLLNAAGQVAFQANNLRNTVGGTADNSGIYLFNGTTLASVARTNTTVPEGNGQFSSFKICCSTPPVRSRLTRTSKTRAAARATTTASI